MSKLKTTALKFADSMDRIRMMLENSGELTSSEVVIFKTAAALFRIIGPLTFAKAVRVAERML